MSRGHTKMLMVSANVGSIFEDPDKMLKMWLREFLGTIKELDPDFLAIHCQEVGGKNYEESMQHVNLFIKSLLASEEMQQFDKARIILDEDFTAAEKFTALGNLYFIHQSVQNVQIFDFQACQFVPLLGREVLSGNIENVNIKEKAKFPQEFFPDLKWSRKGFIRTRWNIRNTIFDLVNIHNFHDASNIVSLEKSPSLYTFNRKRALLHTLERFQKDEYDTVPLFIFGDFNFRLDTLSLVQKLTQHSRIHKTRGKKNDVSQIVYTEEANGQTVMKIGKKEFEHCEHDNIFSGNSKWLRAFDQEALEFHDKLHEYDIAFPPSYPFSEDVDDGRSYMRTRCPSWCDRIFLTHSAKGLVQPDSSTPEYSMIGDDTCMGDHKPIFLNFKLRHEPGKAGAASEADSPVFVPTRTHAPFRKVISINGEEFDAAAMEDINIHDFSTFELEEYMTEKFRNSIKRHSSGEGAPSFRVVARNILRVDSVIQAMKKFSHRSDTDDSDDDLDEEEEDDEFGNHDEERSDMVEEAGVILGAKATGGSGDTNQNNTELVGIVGATMTSSDNASAATSDVNQVDARLCNNNNMLNNNIGNKNALKASNILVKQQSIEVFEETNLLENPQEKIALKVEDAPPVTDNDVSVTLVASPPCTPAPVTPADRVRLCGLCGGSCVLL